LRSLDEDETLWNPEEEFLPHDAKAAIMQYALDEVWRRSNSVLQDGDPENLYGELLDDDEPLAEEARGSIRTKAAAAFYYLYAKGSTKRLPPHNFELHNSHPIEMPNDARMVVFGDWGSGIPNARLVAREIWESHVEPVLGTQQQLHVVHLGDAYYAGFGREYRKRFTCYWPVYTKQRPPNVFSWTVPGNHDMYAGGHGFYEMLANDERFDPQGNCSYFLLENEFWQVFGLDTSSTPNPGDWDGSMGVLNQEQIDFIRKHRDGFKRCLLFTHHQPFCAYSHVDDGLATQLKWLLDEHEITAWFWGHDHHCAVYEQHLNISFPVLLGHAGFPARKKSPTAGRPVIKFEWPATVKRRFIGRTYLKFGFATLQFNNKAIEVRLIDLNGTDHYQFEMF
jgi:hypothetical protein